MLVRQMLILIVLITLLMSSTPALSIACWNMRGFNGAVPYIKELLKQNDILLLCEHWLHANRLNRFNEIADNIKFCARASKSSSAENYGTRRGQGGVAIIWKDNIKGISEIKDLIHDRICGIRLQNPQGAIFNIFSIYLPSRGSDEDYGSVLDDLYEIVISREMGSLSIIGGDANGDIGSMGGVRSQRVNSQQGALLFNCIEKLGLVACNLMGKAVGPVDTHTGPTGTSTLDYIFVPIEIKGQVKSCIVSCDDTLNTSDHECVSAVIELGLVKARVVNTIRNSIKRWDKLSHEQITETYTMPVELAMAGICTDLDLAEPSLDILNDTIEKIVEVLKEKSEVVPCSKFRKNIKPFWNKTLTCLKRQKVSKYRLWVEKGRPRGNSLEWEEHKKARKEFNKELRKLSRSYENEQIAKATKAAECDRNMFWKLLKKCRNGDGESVSAIRNSQGKVVYELDDILTAWRQHFTKIYTPVNDPKYDREHYEYVNLKVKEYNEMVDTDRFLENDFSFKEVELAVNKLHSKKACGMDGISAEHLKYGGKSLVSVLRTLFNWIIGLEQIPTNFRRGIQIPLYKGKNSCCLDMNNYRGITLLTNFSKIFENLVWARLEDWWSKDSVITDLQGACRKGQSCVHTAYLLQETVSTALETSNNVIVAYYDVSKAFDTVWVEGLFYKLYNLGVTGKTWRVL